MFTLDETTLFYFTLACSTSGPKIKTGAIDRWAQATATQSKPVRLRPSSRASTTIAASTASKTTSASVRRYVAPSTLTGGIVISSFSGPVKTEDTSDVEVGGLLDEDETQGPEHDAAASSPVKGNNRKDSDVCFSAFFTFLLFDTNFYLGYYNY